VSVKKESDQALIWKDFMMTGSGDPVPFGDTISYEIGAKFIDGLPTEDWGSGYGWFMKVHTGPYTAVNNVSVMDVPEIVADLHVYKSSTPAIFLRAVLEHTTNWRSVLNNAIASATEKIVLVVTTPDGNDKVIKYIQTTEIPDIALPWQEIDKMFLTSGWNIKKRVLETSSHNGIDAIWLAQKNK
jgi:hypothetical protein